ncbi:aminoglycoside phosphotransferase family protein [Piscinibacter sp.]|uniref:aminoglycoside phosphotransferase family protein n=1 Tax=Piscinibacter sp. TaxID=1903157 RepID=UPI002BD60574|nr:phosphotransferase [Albitalea sp.]HUG23622.1 phosphotransferase [Albitalea sp.]
MTAAHSPSATDAVHWADDARHASFDAWLDDVAPRHGLQPATLRPASADASFRRYLRVDGAGASYIVMDAPPAHEDVRPFVHIAALMHAAGLNAPVVVEQSAEQGFLLLSDLGSRLYLDELQAAVKSADDATVTHLMRDAVAALIVWQQQVDASSLPPYDEALLRREMQLFPDWCVEREYGQTWTDTQQTQWKASTDLLVQSALAQATVAVHRDYMPRNLMVGTPNPGILDFQDAVRGPISYDPASLLRDAFISWDEEQEIDWAVRYWEQANKVGLPVPPDFGEFWRQLEWMGLQRHLKVLGIFCRLKHRDGKAKYSEDLPRFFRYSHHVASRYNGLGPLARLLEPLMGETRTDVYF